MKTSHRQFIPISLDTVVVAVPPSARYTAVLDLEWTALSLPLLLTSQSSGSVEMTQVDGRHRLREYGVFTRLLIFSPDPDLPSCVDSPICILLPSRIFVAERSRELGLCALLGFDGPGSAAVLVTPCVRISCSETWIAVVVIGICSATF